MRKKRFSQVFLQNRRVIDQFVAALPPPSKGRTVLEIGAGGGAVTRALLEAGYAVSAVEIDPDWSRELARINGDLTVTESSILSLQPRDLVPLPATIIGSLPYHISGAILRWLADHAEQIDCAVLILQEEVVKRICAVPGGRERGILSVVIQSVYDVKPLFRISPGSFVPPPQVWSKSVRLCSHGEKMSEPFRQELWRIAGLLFQQRRKMIGGRIEKLFGMGTYDWLQAAGLDLTRRPETLTLAEFQLVTHAVHKTR